MTQADSFTQFVQATIAATPVHERLKANSSVVLERIARGAGNTNWYFCENDKNLESVESRLRPGSLVSFYFDGRIKQGPFCPDVWLVLEQMILEDGEALIGTLLEDGPEIKMLIVSGPGDLDEEDEAQLLSVSRVFYGLFPASDNDGINAVTVTLPDADGIVRPHPY